MFYIVRNIAKKIFYFVNWLRFALSNWSLKHLDFSVKFNNPSHVTLGKNSSANAFTFFDTKGGEVIAEENVKIGDHCRFVALNKGNRITIGQNTTIHGACQFTGDIEIGKDCLIARNIFLSSYTHDFKVEPGLTIKEQDQLAENLKQKISKKIIIEDDVWLSWGCVILPGVRIAKGSVIGANAVVTKDTEPYGVYGGVPAQKISTRK